MKRLGLQIVIVSFFLVMSSGVVQSMELTSQSRKKSTKSLCVQPVCDFKMYYLLEDLKHLPIKYAVESILSVDDDWMTQDENRQRLIEEVNLNDTLDDEVACAVVQKLNDLALAHRLAEQAKITNGVASVIVNSFLKTDIALRLHHFDSLFDKSFPGKILEHGNHVIVYKVLMDAMTQDVSVVVNPPVNNSLSMRDFRNGDICSTEISAETYATADSKNNFFVMNKSKTCIQINNIQNKIVLYITVPFEIAGLGFLDGNASSLCILSTHNKVYEFAMPLALLRAEIPLQHLAALVYCKAQVYKKTRNTRECIGHTVFESKEYGEESKLVTFMQENLHKEWVSSFLKDSLKRDSEKLHDVVILRNAFDDLASIANMTREALAIELYITQSHEAWNFVEERYRDLKTISLIENFGGTFSGWYGSK